MVGVGFRSGFRLESTGLGFRFRIGFEIEFRSASIGT